MADEDVFQTFLLKEFQRLLEANDFWSNPSKQ